MNKESLITIATYNIYLAKNKQEIFKNIIKLVKMGVNVFCLQEVLKTSGQSFIIDDLLKHLGKNWKAIYYLGNEGSYLDFGTCILWDTRVLLLEKTEKITLPLAKPLAPHEAAFGLLVGFPPTIPQRRTITGLFRYKNRSLLLSCIHLDTINGATHRLEQVAFLLRQLNKKYKASYQIICGDFNSFDLLKTGKEKKELQSVFGTNFVDSSENISWTADLYRINTPKQFPFFVLLIKLLNIHIKRRLDYIWVKNLQVYSCESFDILGSDHLPVVTKLRIP